MIVNLDVLGCCLGLLTMLGKRIEMLHENRITSWDAWGRSNDVGTGILKYSAAMQSLRSPFV